ncbi:MAG: hypothetical protein ACJAUL_002693 [Paraglaciecola sp.]|jgi:hypothetical protein
MKQLRNSHIQDESAGMKPLRKSHIQDESAGMKVQG